MPFIEFIFAIVGFVIIVALVIAIASAYAMFGIGATVFLLATGWIPILMCATDYHMNVGSGFIGTWAMYSIFAYLGASAVLTAVMIIRPDPDGLPPAWKFLALFYKYRTVDAVTTAAAGGAFAAGSFFKAAKQEAESTYKSLDETRKLKAANKKLNAEAERVSESKKAAETAMKIELLKAEEAELKKKRKRLEQETKKHDE